MAEAATGNLLGHESSPYLRQHKDNPVHWHPWSRAALDEAAALGRPILLSVGYAACHWCHVMAHESFEDAEVAAVMNRLFVNIKVDREERPDIDQIYIAALNATGEQGGWPLTMFLTPEGRPFWGGTYFPRHARYGRPGFIEVLEAVSRTWNEKKEDLARSADALTRHVEERLAPAAAQSTMTSQMLPEFAGSVFSAMDPVRGGLKGAPKFPNAPFMSVLWLNWLQNGAADQRDAVALSLRRMLSGGIYDHVGGGLCRYSTDALWLVPHFEKMLYDNAQLVTLAGWASATSGDDLFRIRIEETVNWLRREMVVPGGGFASSLDADSDGEEGSFYLWTEAELEAALGESRTRTLLTAYELASPDGWEGRPILHRLAKPSFGEADRDPAFAEIKRDLLGARERRNRPGRDDKALVDWNGLMISALARASRIFGRPDWAELAGSAFRFVSESESPDGRLPHSILGDERLYPCMASDYAAMISAAICLNEATGDSAYVTKALAWLKQLDRWHGDETGKGYYLTATDSADVPIRIRGDVDEAVPSATAQIIEAMLRLSMQTSDGDLYDRVTTIAEAALGRTRNQSFGRAGLIHAAELVRQPRKLIIVDEGARPFVSVANRCADAARTDIMLSVGVESAAIAMPDGALLDASRPGAWLCIGQTCLPPVRTPSELETLLNSRR